MERSRWYRWVVRVAWAGLPFVAGPALAAALDERSAPVRTTVSAGLWAVWAVVLCATLVLHPVSLTVVRMAAPAAAAAAGWALAQAGEPTPAGLAGLLGATVAAVLAYLPETGMLYVNGPAYPNERRYPLRPPGPLLFGPVPLAWLLTAASPVAAAVLLATGRWVAGGVAAAAAAALVPVMGRALHGLSRRWLVFVPAGVVVHDPLTLADPVLFRRQTVASFDLAPAGTTATDLTQGAPGLALELRLDDEVALVLARPGGRVGATVKVTSLLVTPTRPGRVLAEARHRRFPPAPPIPATQPT